MSNVENLKLLKYGVISGLVLYFHAHKGTFVMYKCKL